MMEDMDMAMNDNKDMVGIGTAVPRIDSALENGSTDGGVAARSAATLMRDGAMNPVGSSDGEDGRVEVDGGSAPGNGATPAEDSNKEGVSTRNATDAPVVFTEPTAEYLAQQRANAVAGYDDMIDNLYKRAEQRRPETDEERAKREKKERSKKIIAAVGDGISALSNLFFTTRYAPNMYNHDKGSALKTTMGNIDKLKAEREKREAEYNNFVIQIGGLKNDRARTLRELEAEQERRAIARQAAKQAAKEHEWKEALQPDIQREHKGKADKAGYDAQTAQAKAGKAGELAQAEVDAKIAQGESYKASAANSRASAAAHNRSNPLEYRAWDRYGKEHRFKEENAAATFAKQEDTWEEYGIEEVTEVESTDYKGRKTSKSSTKSKKGGRPMKPFDIDQYKRSGGKGQTPPPLN